MSVLFGPDGASAAKTRPSAATRSRSTGSCARRSARTKTTRAAHSGPGRGGRCGPHLRARRKLHAGALERRSRVARDLQVAPAPALVLPRPDRAPLQGQSGGVVPRGARQAPERGQAGRGAEQLRAKRRLHALLHQLQRLACEHAEWLQTVSVYNLVREPAPFVQPVDNSECS